MSDPIFSEKYEKYFKMPSAEIFTQRAKCYGLYWLEQLFILLLTVM